MNGCLASSPESAVQCRLKTFSEFCNDLLRRVIHDWFALKGGVSSRRLRITLFKYKLHAA